MKPIVLVLLSALAPLAACQHAAPATTEAAATLNAGISAAKSITAVSADTALTALMRHLLQRHNLAPLWANQTQGPAASHAMEGFYGASPYRISFYFTKVERDTADPALFHVTGLDRYHKIITPFTGTIHVRAVRPFADSLWADVDTTARCFTAIARFVLREDPQTKGAGNYAGQALLDFYQDAEGKIGYAGGMLMDAYKNPTRGTGLLFRGTQVSNATGRRQPVAFANFYGAVVPQTLSKLGLGDRSEEVNPNLAKLGWNEAWENDEWWADSPKPKLSL